MSDGHPWELLVRHGADRLTPEERDHLAVWSADDPEHARLMRRVQRLVTISRAADAADHTTEAWNRIQQRIGEQGDGARVLHVRPPRFEPMLTRRSWAARAGALTAAAMLAAIGVGLWHKQQPEVPVLREITTHRGERLELGLPDGSRVVLGPESRLSYDAAGFAHERTLRLEGEGFFTVAHDARQPFVVHARGSATQAVGTAFGVRAYPEDSAVRVAVTAGRVLLRPEHAALGSGTMLSRGDVGELDGSGRTIARRGVDVASYVAWTGGEIRFVRTPLAEVLRELRRAYDVEFVLTDSTAASLPITATLRQQSVEELARTLAAMLDMRYTREGARIRLRPNHTGG